LQSASQEKKKSVLLRILRKKKDQFRYLNNNLHVVLVATSQQG
jgi:hypothetical protein